MAVISRNVFLASNGGQPKVLAHSGLEIRVCVRTYRFFYVSNTEDVLWRLTQPDEAHLASQKLQAKNLLRKKWLGRTDGGSLPLTSGSR
jgi:paired amphipathic helix protein Sin3a